MRLKNKTAVVTGGTTGIGFATARRMLDEGVSRLVITGQNEARLRDAAASLGANVRAVRADVRSLPDLDRLQEEVKAFCGDKLDILFANAGLGRLLPVEQVDEAFYDEVFDTNVKGLFFSVQKLLPLMGRGASIVLTASSVSGKGVPGGHVYFATKAAVRSLARTLAAELAPRGIRVNAVSPGLIPTPFVDHLGLDEAGKQGLYGMMKAATPLARLGEPEEIAPAVVYLASDEASYVTAADLLVDGGWMNV